MSIKTIFLYLLVGAATLVGVELFRRWSLKRKLLDIPNDRSSHSNPTPRGGGLIICAVSLSALSIIFASSPDGYQSVFLAGALLVAVISLIDDIKTVSPFWRFLFHSLAAALTVWFLGGFGRILIPFQGIVETGFWGDFAAFFWIVWLINAYNFMDGIDGIAATQGVTAGIGWGLLGMVFGIENAFVYGTVLAVSSFGFLILNWQPAKIFMGDVGSAFLGYSFAVLPLLAAKQISNPEIAAQMPWFGVLLVWFFVFDSVLTLLKRLWRKEKVWQPHRQHIYQQMVISGLSHASVTLIYGIGSLILIAVVFFAVQNRQSPEKIVFGAVIVETLALVLIWRQQVSKANSQKGFEQ